VCTVNQTRCVRLVRGIADRTETATASAKGAWKAVEADTRRTDCVARATGPSLQRQSQAMPMLGLGRKLLTDLLPLQEGSKQRSVTRCHRHKSNIHPISSHDHHELAI
jgi:hypothetical protein